MHASGDTPPAAARRGPLLWFLAVATLVTLGRLVYIGFAPPSGDELYYWHGSRTLNWCYHDFPVVVPALIRAATELFGHSTFAIRLACPLFFLFIAIQLYRWGRRTGTHPWTGALAGLLALIGLPAAAIGAVYASTDSALAFAWFFASYFLAQAVRTGANRDWLATGLFLLLGCLSKYPMVFWVAGAFVYLVMDPARRRWLARPQPYVVLALGALSAIPFLVWNAQHEWEALLFQVSGRHTLSPSASHIAGMLAGQILLGSPILLVALVLAIRWALRVRKTHPQRDVLDLLVVFSLTTLVVLLPIGVVVRVSPFWPAVGYPLAALLLALWATEPAPGQPRRLRWVNAGIALSVVLLAGLHTAVFRPYLIFDLIGARLESVRPSKFSPRQLQDFYGWRELAARVSELARAEPAPFILTPKTTFCSYLAFYTDRRYTTFVYYERLPDGKILGETANSVLSQVYWQETGGLAGRPGLYVTNRPNSPTTERVRGLFRDWRLVEEVPVTFRGRELRRFYIYRGEAFAGWPTPRP